MATKSPKTIPLIDFIVTVQHHSNGATTKCKIAAATIEDAKKAAVTFYKYPCHVVKVVNDDVDELAELHEFLAPYLDKYEKLKKAVAATVPVTDDAYTVSGERFDIDYTAPAQQLKCNVDSKDFIKATKAWDAVTVSVTKAKECLTEDQLKMLFTEEQGARRFKRVRLNMEAMTEFAKAG